MRQRRQPPEQPEPDTEGLPVRPPRVAPELRHHRQGERGVADEDDEKEARAGLADELEPDEEDQAEDRRPPAEPARILGGVPAGNAEVGS